MVQWLNKKLKALAFCTLLANLGFAQEVTPVYEDYKDPDQFEKFRRRAIVVGAWQINSLKEDGALVVKLKTNKLLIDQLILKGDKKLADEKLLEQFAINKNTMFAYKDNFTFCKLYFIYSNSSDSLLNGTRQGIFLDTNMVVDASITMTEKFYLIAERDYAYSSSIGFVKEDSARFIKESGNPIKFMSVIVKNKYGHQLKSPFPFSAKEKTFTDVAFNFPIQMKPLPGGGAAIQFTIDRNFLTEMKTRPETKKNYLVKEDGTIQTTVKLKKEYTYEKLSIAIADLNEGFFQFYKRYPKPDLERVRPEIKLFLY